MLRPTQEPRPAYHRRQDLARLRTLAAGLPVRVEDDGAAYVVWLALSPPCGAPLLLQGRHEVIAAYLVGWTHALGLAPSDAAAPPQ
jgi:hypothetical protein